jgi:hypothetical protein
MAVWIEDTLIRIGRLRFFEIGRIGTGFMARCSTWEDLQIRSRPYLFWNEVPVFSKESPELTQRKILCPQPSLPDFVLNALPVGRLAGIGACSS